MKPRRVWGMALAGVHLAALAGPPAAVAAPRAVIDAGPPDRTPQTSATFAFHVADPSPPLLGVVAPTSFECRLDGGAWRACGSPAAYGSLVGGPHTFAVRAAGGLDDHTPASRAWVVEVLSQTLPPCGGATCPDPVKPGPPAPAPKPRKIKRRDAGGCPYAANYPGEVALRRLEAAVRCLFGRERRKRSLPALHASRALRAAATLHAYDMFLHKYFAHVSRSGRTPLQRALRAGYFAPGQFGVIGEVLAWGDGRYATPRATVVGFMRSPAHRRIILDPNFRELG